MKKVSKIKKEEFEEIRLVKNSLIKLPGGAEIKVRVYEEDHGQTGADVEATVPAQNENGFVQIDFNTAHICWDSKALRSRRNGFELKNIPLEKNTVGAVYDYKQGMLVLACRIPKNSKKN